MARLDALLEAALELPLGERAEFLAGLGDEELSREVAELLSFAEPETPTQVASEGGLLSRLGSWVREQAAAEEVPDRRVGAYRLVEQIGSGGMGVVYRAERADGAFEQRVALKLLPGGRLSADAIHLFEQERQILAGLTHENIGRLLDGGVDSLGRPFLAMELVEGLPIDRYCEHHGLDLRARLQLFRTVCMAVQYAHQNLVVHRDLKPGNILVTHEGVAKLVDFGIAKVLGPVCGIQQPEVGQPSLRLLSPSHASPEQIEGQPVTTASDVYSMGVVLFQLITGRLPHEIAGGIEPFFSRVLVGVAPLASSCLRGAPRRWVRGDLDATVAKALARDPCLRYPTAEQLGDDIGRLLENLPVAARKSSSLYRLGKWVRRHAVVAPLAALAVMAVSLALVTAVWQAREATRARELAEHQAAVAERISEVLVEVFERADTNPAGEEAIVTTLLDPAAERIGKELADSPEVQAALMDALGRAYWRLGRYEAARPLAEEALALRLKMHPRPHRSVALSQRLLGEIVPSFGELDRSASLLRASLSTLEEIAAREPLEIADGETVLSHALGTLGDDAGCEALRRRSLARFRQHLGDRHPRVAPAFSHLGNVLVRRGKALEAEPLFLRALEIHRERGGGNLVAEAIVLRNLAQARLQLGRLAAAEATARKALEVSLLAYGLDHPNLGHSFDILARVLVARGAIDAAEPWAIRALETYTAGNPGGRTRTVLMHGTLVEIALLRQDFPRAEVHLQAARELVARVTPPGHLAQAMVESLQGRVLASQGLHREALAILEPAFEELRRRQGPASLALRRTALALAEIHKARGDGAAARRYRPFAEPPSFS